MEDPRLVLDVISRVIHVGTAIVLLGGTVFVRFVLLPAAEKLSPEAHETLRASVGRVWKYFVHAGVALLLLSGLYNYIVVGIPNHRGDSLYHMLMGIKILIALAVFFLAEALVGRAPAFTKMRESRKAWLGVIIALATVIVAISGYLKVGRPPIRSPAETTASSHRREHLADGVPKLVHPKRLVQDARGLVDDLDEG